MKKVFSGIKPSGDIHLGNYLGAIKNWVKSQGEFDNIFCIVDLHAITVEQEPNFLRQRTREQAALLLACGISPEKSTLFIQSHVAQHTELAWILNCFIPMGWMKKMTQFKEKSEGKKERVSVGLFDYPALMAADILLYDTDIVPVGQDQKQHVELARDVAKRFNSVYGEIFKLPEARIQDSGSRIMGLQQPEKKMSKSGGGENNLIYLLDSPEQIRAKIMSAVTDSENKISFDEKRPGIFNLLVIYEKISGLDKKDIEKKFSSKGYVDFKKELSVLIVRELEPIHERYKELIEDQSQLDSILKKGAEKLRPLAENKISKIKNAIGLVDF